MSPAPSSCVVFDIDDTLYLERDYVRSGFVAIGDWAQANVDVDLFGEQAWELFEQGRRNDIFDEVFRRNGRDVPADAIALMVEVYRSHTPDIAMLPDARRLAERLAGRAALAVVTDGPLASQRAKADALELGRWADPIVFTAELGPDRGKPHPQAFELVQDTTGCSGPACTYVADNPAKDFAGPRSLGWKAVRVRRAGSLHEQRPSGGDVDVEVADLDEVAALVP